MKRFGTVCEALRRLLPLLCSFPLLAARAGDLDFSNPAHTPSPPAGAIGFADRSPDLDVLPGFVKPPPGYGTVPFFWWLGDPLTRERLGWILNQMGGMGVSGYQINYAHSDRGGRSYGLTYPSEPPLFSESWWNLVGWFMGEAKKQGAGISLSDYTLGFGQGWCVDEILREHPEVTGMVLRMDPEGKVSAEHVPWSLNPMHPMAGKWYAEKFFGQFERHFPGEGGKGLNFFFSDELSFGVSGRLWSSQFADEFKKRKGYDLTAELPGLFKDIGPRTPKVRLDYSDVLVALSEEGFFKPVFDWHQQRGMILGCDHGGRGRDVVEFGDYFRTQRWNQGPGADQPQLGKDLIKAKVAASIAHLYQRPRVWLEGFYGSGWGTTSAGFADATFYDFVLGYNLLGIHGMYYSTHGGWWEWAPPDNTFRMPYWAHLRGFFQCLQRLGYVLSQGHHRCDVAILYPVAAKEAGMDGDAAVKAAFATAQDLYGAGIDFDFMDFESLARAQAKDTQLQVSGESYRALVIPSMKAVRFSTLQKAVEFHRAGGLVVLLGALPEASDRIGRNDPELDALVAELKTRAAQPEQVRELVANAFQRDYAGPGIVQHRKVGPRDLYAIYNSPKDAEAVLRATGKVELWNPWDGTTRPLQVISQKAGSTRLKLPLTEKEVQLIVFSPGAADLASHPQEKPVTVIPVPGDWEFELQPTLDNRFGDFRWPPTPTRIGAEIRQLWYCEGDTTNGPWRKVTCSFGPQFMQFTNFPATAGGKPYEFSWRWGIQTDPGHQGYHGLKEEVHDEFLAIGKTRNNGGHMPNVVSYEADGDPTYFSTSVVAPHDMLAYALTGSIKPAQVWLNGEVVAGKMLKLKAGANPLMLEYTGPGRTYFVVSTQPEESAAQGEVFSSSAFWIWYPGDKTRAERWFRKSFNLSGVPAPARLRVTCDNGYAVSINGTAVGSGTRWETVEQYDVTKALRVGRNEIVVCARNDGSEAGLIAELTAGTTRIATDRTWRAARTETGASVDAEEIASFTDSLWYKHQNGPPKLEPVASGQQLLAGAQSQSKPGNLAMSWWTNSSVLPFDVRANEAKPVGWYRFVSPPGLRTFRLTARGRVQAWAGGQALEGTGKGKFSLSPAAAKPVTVLLRIEQERGCYGGAALPEPIQLDCGPGQIALGDWAQNEGLLSYSGGAWYRKTVTVPATHAQEVLLELGDVVASAEVRVNGQSAGIKVAPPWKLDITKFVRPGANRIEVLVCNTLANHYTTVPTQYRGSTVAGLLGPVRLEMQ